MEAVTTALTTGIEEISTSLLSSVAAVAPKALPILGAVMVITIGIKVFKKVTGRA